MFSPLEQFENHIYKPFLFLGYDFAVSAFLLATFSSVVFLYVIRFFKSYHMLLVPSPFQYVIESFYLFILSIIRSQTGSSGLVYFPLVITIFIFIFCCNFLGLVPLSFISTAQIFLPFFLSFSLNIGLVIIGFYKHGLSFMRLFVPSGISKVLIPLVFVIELFTYLLRPFSLAIRLFANMMAGHTLFFICTITLHIGLLTSTFVFASGIFLVLAVFILETVISFLQAYVFSVLFCVYLNDSLHPGH
jgi:F-type H+-transporting ATPase subunit a